MGDSIRTSHTKKPHQRQRVSHPSAQVALGDTGVVSAISPGKAYVDMSTVDEATSAQIAAAGGWHGGVALAAAGGFGGQARDGVRRNRAVHPLIPSKPQPLPHPTPPHPPPTTPQLHAPTHPATHPLALPNNPPTSPRRWRALPRGPRQRQQEARDRRPADHPLRRRRGPLRRLRGGV